MEIDKFINDTVDTKLNKRHSLLLGVIREIKEETYKVEIPALSITLDQVKHGSLRNVHTYIPVGTIVIVGFLSNDINNNNIDHNLKNAIVLGVISAPTQEFLLLEYNTTYIKLDEQQINLSNQEALIQLNDKKINVRSGKTSMEIDTDVSVTCDGGVLKVNNGSKRLVYYDDLEPILSRPHTHSFICGWSGGSTTGSHSYNISSTKCDNILA